MHIKVGPFIAAESSKFSHHKLLAILHLPNLLPLIPMIALQLQVKALSLVAVGTAAIGAVFWTLAPASAAVFNFSYSGNNVNTSGVLTTGPLNPANNNYTVTGISGTRNNVLIDALLAPSTCCGNPPNDNFLSAGSPQLDESGFSYRAGGINYNPYYYALTGQSYEYNSTITDPNAFGTPVTFTATPAAVPAPSYTVALICGMGVWTVGTVRRLIQARLGMTQ